MDSDSYKFSVKEYITAFILYFIAAVLLYNHAIINNIMIAPGDAFFYDFPHRTFIAEQFRNYSFPFWFPYEFLGMPEFGSMQGGVLYPINWLYIIFIHPFTFNFILLLHFSLAGLFTFVYLRQLNLHIPSAFYGGAVFAFTGFIQAHRGHVSMMNAAAWLPLILFLYEKIRVHSEARFSLIAGLVISIQFFAGHIHTTMLSGLFIFYYIIFILLTTDKEKRIKNILLSFLPFVICLFICLPQLYSTFCLKSLSNRDAIDYSGFSSFSLNLYFLPNFIFPQYFRIAEYQGYIGIFPLFLALPVFILELRKNKYVRFFCIVAILSFILSLGKNTPFYKIMYYVPVYNLFRAPVRNFLLLNLALSFISAIGIEQMMYSDDKKRKSYNKILLYMFTFLPCLFFIIDRIITVLLSGMDNSKVIDMGEEVLYYVKDVRRFIDINNPVIYVPFIIMSLYLITLLAHRILRIRKSIYYTLLLLLFAESYIFINSDKNNWRAFTDLDEIKKRDYSVFIKQNSKNYERNASFTFNGTYRTLYENVNGLYTLNGNDPFINKNLSSMLYLDCYGNFGESGLLLNNNMLLSSLGTRYILSSQKDEKDNTNYDVPILNTIFRTSDKVSSDSIELNNPVGNFKKTESDTFILKAEAGEMGMLSFQLTGLMNNTDYMISAEYKTENNNYDSLIIDIYGGGTYDDAEREFYVNNKGREKKFRQIKRGINTGTIKSDNVSLRFFTSSASTYEIRKISFREFQNNTPPLNHTAKSIVNSKSQPIKTYEERIKVPRYNIYENINYINRVFSVKKVLPAEDIDEVKNAFYAFGINAAEECLVWKKDYEELKNIKFVSSDVLIKKYSPNEVVLDVNVPENSGFIILSDQYYPHWKASVDDKPVKIYEVNGLIRGVVVPAGKHTLTFTYNSLLEKILLTSTVLFLLSLCVYLFLSFTRNRKENILS